MRRRLRQALADQGGRQPVWQGMSLALGQVRFLPTLSDVALALQLFVKSNTSHRLGGHILCDRMNLSEADDEPFEADKDFSKLLRRPNH